MALTQYTDRYIYDKGLNLTNIHHNQDAPQVQGAVLSSNRLLEFDYDAAGNQLETENVDDITYNCDGQIALTKKTTSEVTVTEYYTYAVLGHRVKKVTKTVTSDVVTGIDVVLYVGGNEYRTSYTGTDLFYDGDVVTGNVSVTQDNIETRVKSGQGQLAKITQNSQSQGTSYSYNLINNIDSNSVEIDNTSSIVSHQSFYPYGGVASTQGSTNNKQLGYSGQELDSTSLNDYGFRYYNSKAGRWTRPDPIGFRSGQLNLYAMVGGDPVTKKDMMGFSDFEKVVKVLVNNWIKLFSLEFNIPNIPMFLKEMIYQYTNSTFAALPVWSNHHETIYFGNNPVPNPYDKEIDFIERIKNTYGKKSRDKTIKMYKKWGIRGPQMSLHGGMVAEQPWELLQCTRNVSSNFKGLRSLVDCFKYKGDKIRDLYNKLNEVVMFERHFSSQLIDYKKSINDRKYLLEKAIKQQNILKKEEILARFGKRFSKAAMVYAARNKMKIFMNLDNIEFLKDSLDPANKNETRNIKIDGKIKNVHIYDSISAAEIRFAIKYHDKNQDKDIKNYLENSSGYEQTLRALNHQIVYAVINSDGFFKHVTFLKNGKKISVEEARSLGIPEKFQE